MAEPLPYRLSLAAEFERFRPELEYACAFLDRAHLLERRPEAQRVLHYGPGAPAGAVAVPAALFPDGVRLKEDGVRLDRTAFAAIAEGRGRAPLLPPHGGATPGDGPGYDALGLIFFMLSRIEEREAPSTDRYGRFRCEDALATRLGRHADPLADAAARDLARALTGREDVANRTRYALRLTHDVDRLRGYHRLLEPLRNAAGDLVKRRRPAAAWRRLKSAYLGGEPWRSLRRILGLAERFGLESWFYLMGPTQHPMDSPYACTMADTLKRVADEILRRGHRIGFHPGFATFDDAAEWRRQRDGLEALLGRTVREGRQHVLRYDAVRTPEIWDEAGMARDDTLAFPETCGFRSGTCRPFNAYSLRQRRMLGLEQCATAITDFGLFGGKYRDLDPDAAMEECRTVRAACQRYGGELVVLYHAGASPAAEHGFLERLLEEFA